MAWKGDPHAFHNDVDGEIDGLTEKATPVDADLIVIEDSADTNSKKKAQLGNLPGGGTDDHGALTGLADDDHTQYLLADGTRQAVYVDLSGLTGATNASRYVGATTSGAPASGTFAVGDFVITQDGNVYICTTAGSPGTWTQVGAAAATDSDAIHDNVAAEISAITEKASPASGDWLLIEDAADSNNKKKVDWGNLPSGGNGGGGVYNVVSSVDTPPGTADPMDDEFDDGSFDTGLWSDLNIGGVTKTETDHGLVLSVNEGVDNARGIYQTAPSGDFVFRAKVHKPSWVSNRMSFLFVGESTVGRLYYLGYWIETLRAIQHATPTTAASSWGIQLGTAGSALWNYFEIAWDDTAETLTFRHSNDGIAWSSNMASSIASGWTPGIVGLGLTNRLSLQVAFGFDWFRRIS